MLKLFKLESADIAPGAVAQSWTNMENRVQPMVCRISDRVARAFDLIRINGGIETLLDLKEGAPAIGYTYCFIRVIVLEVGQDFGVMVKNTTDAHERFEMEVWGQLRDRDPGHNADRYLRILYEAEDSRRRSPGGELDEVIEAHYACKLDEIYELLTPAEIDLIESEAVRLINGGALPWDSPKL